MDEKHNALTSPDEPSNPPDQQDRPWAVFLIFLQLGLTSFGGPVAHLAFFREAFVAKRHWLTEQSYADLVALCQFLPGPASSQVGLALGYQRAGLRGALAAWTGFTLPSALCLILLAASIDGVDSGLMVGAISGLKLVALAVIVQALWGMAKSLCPDPPRIVIMFCCTAMVVAWPSLFMQFGVIGFGALAGVFILPRFIKVLVPQVHEAPARSPGAHWFSCSCLIVFVLLLFLLPLIASLTALPSIGLFDSFYRAGALVFGGGHVVLPMLQTEVVQSGLVSESLFLAGYGATQAVPGPIFTFAAYLGAISTMGPGGLLGGLLCLIAIFLPSFLLVLGALPYWDSLRVLPTARAALNGVNAAVVGLLLATLYFPVWGASVYSWLHACVALAAWLALQHFTVPVWLVVLAGGLVGMVVF